MGTIKHPSGSDAVTPQQGGGTHVRGTETKNPDTARKIERERSTPDIDADADRADSGPDARDALIERGRDLDQNPGIGSSKGSFGSGERGPGSGRDD